MRWRKFAKKGLEAWQQTRQWLYRRRRAIQWQDDITFFLNSEAGFYMCNSIAIHGCLRTDWGTELVRKTHQESLAIIRYLYETYELDNANLVDYSYVKLSYWSGLLASEHRQYTNAIRIFLRGKAGKRMLDDVYSNCVDDSWDFPFFTFLMLFGDNAININESFIDQITKQYAIVGGQDG